MAGVYSSVDTSTLLATTSIDPFTGEAFGDTVAVETAIIPVDDIVRKFDPPDAIQTAASQVRDGAIMCNAFIRIVDCATNVAVYSSIAVQNTTLPIWNASIRIEEDRPTVRLEVCHYVAENDAVVLGSATVNLTYLLPQQLDRETKRSTVPLVPREKKYPQGDILFDTTRHSIHRRTPEGVFVVDKCIEEIQKDWDCSLTSSDLTFEGRQEELEDMRQRQYHRKKEPFSECSETSSGSMVDSGSACSQTSSGASAEAIVSLPNEESAMTLARRQWLLGLRSPSALQLQFAEWYLRQWRYNKATSSKRIQYRVVARPSYLPDVEPPTPTCSMSSSAMDGDGAVVQGRTSWFLLKIIGAGTLRLPTNDRVSAYMTRILSGYQFFTRNTLASMDRVKESMYSLESTIAQLRLDCQNPVPVPQVEVAMTAFWDIGWLCQDWDTFVESHRNA